MSGTAPTPRLFGSDGARQAANPRSADQMQQPVQGRNLIGGGGGAGGAQADWWTMRPERTSLATTTGQNLEGTSNAFDTNFWDVAQRQDSEQTTMAGRWKRPDATGISVYDSEQEGVEFGDVFVGGEKAGNVYRGYGGMTNTDADEIMARLTLPREVWAKAYESESGKPLTFAGSLSEEVQARRQQVSEDFAKGLTAEAFEAGASERVATMESSNAWRSANVGAGAVGGAIAGGAVGSIIPVIGTAVGAVVGGALGALGSHLNRDEQLQGYARALEQWELATSDGHTALGYADAAAGIAGGVAGYLNVSRNLLHGGYDALKGDIGDGVSSYQTTETPLWMQGADMAALVLDGVGSFGSSVARRTFTSVMGATVASEQASVVLGAAEGNVAFNPYSGQYEDIGAGGMAQRQLSVGIDAAQTGAAGLLGRVLRGGRAARAGEEAISRGGYVVKTVDGVEQAVRPGWSALIPSEAAVGIAARGLARRSVLKSGEEMTRENLAIQTARHLENLTTGRKTIATMAVNGFGEGAEEFVQAVLDATAFGEKPTFRELVEASKAGFGMGAGMGAAIGVGSRSRSAQYLDRANMLRAVRGQDEVAADEWARLTESEQAQLGTASSQEEQRLIDDTVSLLVLHGSRVAAATIPELRRAVEVARQIGEQQARAGEPGVESSRLQSMSNYQWAPQDYVVSLTAAVRDVESRLTLMSAAAAGSEIPGAPGRVLEPEQAEAARRIAESDAQLLQALRTASAAVEEARAMGDSDQVRALVTQVNEMLRKAWAAPAGDADSFGPRRSASVWGARFPLNSAGSFQLMRLQVSPELTFTGTNNQALVPAEILAPTGGDFDGDRIVNMLRELLDEDAYTAQRHGAGQLTSDGTMLAATPDLVAAVSLMFDASQRPGTAEFAAHVEARRAIRQDLNRLLARSPIPAAQRRKLVDQLLRGLATRRPGALSAFFDTLATVHGPAMRELAEAVDGSPWLLLNRIVSDRMRQFMTARALSTGATSRTGQVALPETSDSMPRWKPSLVEQTSDLLQGATAANKYDIFRLQTVLKYNSRREATATTPEETADVLAELYAKFTARNDGLVRPGEDAISEGVIAQRRVINWLRSIAAEAQGALGTATSAEALVLLAGARVDDVDAGTRRMGSDGDVLLIQALLHEVVTGLRSEYAEVMGGDPAIASRLASLDSLTTPTYMAGANTHAQGGDAFVEVLGAFPIHELLGDQGAAINVYTVRQLRDHLASLRPDVREEYVAALRRHNSYAEIEDAAPGQSSHSPYRVLVDNVVESARMQLWEDRDTGVPSGARTRSSASATANFTATHDSVRKLANARGHSMSTAAEARAFLTSDPDLAEAVLALVEERGVRAGTVQRGADGAVEKVHFPQWIYDVFAEKSTARAEMILLRQTLVMAKAGLQTFDDDGNPTDRLDPHRVNDVLLRLWLDLDHRAADRSRRGWVAATAARDDFLALLGRSETVNEFIGALNRDHRFRDEQTPPFIPWARDRSLVSPDRFGKGVSDVQEGTGMRDALRDAATVAAAKLHDEETVQAHLEENADLLSRLRAARDGKDPALWNRVTAWHELAKDLPVQVGASVWISQAGHINEILGNMGVKGVSPIPELGKALAARLPVFDSAAGQLFASMSSGSLGAVLTDATQLAREDRTFVLNDGTVVDWAALTPERLIDLLDDPETVGIAARVAGMTAWDYNAELGANTLVSTVGRGVAGFVADPADALFSRGTESKLRRLMLVEAMAAQQGGPAAAPIIPVLLAQQMNIREAASDHVISDATGERTDMAVRILEDIADALDALSRVDGLYVNSADSSAPWLTPAMDELTGEESTKLHLALLNAGRRARRASGATGNMVAGLLATDGELRDIHHQLVSDWAVGFSTRAVASGDATLMAAARKVVNDLNTVDDYASPLDVLLHTYSRYDDPAVQEQLVRHARAHGDMANVTAWARGEVLRVQAEETPTVTRRAAGRDIELPDLTAAEWEMLARAVIAFTMHTSYGIASSSDTQIALFPSLKKPDELAAQRSFWDPTFVEGSLDIFVPGVLRDPAAPVSPLLAAHMELVRKVGGQLPTMTTEEAEAAVYKLVQPRATTEQGYKVGTTGKWHALVPALMHSAVGAVLASAAESAISMAGINPFRMRMLAATTRQDWTRRPDDSELSTTGFSAAQLVAAESQGSLLTSAIDVQIAGRQGPATRRLGQLEGRVARAVTITVPGGEPVSLLGDHRYGPGLALPRSTGVPFGEGGVLVLPRLSQAVQGYLRDRGVPRDQWHLAQVDVSFFHPDTKSVSAAREPGADYDHSPWFDGVGGRTDAAFSQQSLVGAFLFGLDGAIPAAYNRALGAIKKLHSALQQVTTMPEEDRRRRISAGLTDMAGMLDELTEFALQQKIDGEALELTAYNAVRKIMSLMYVVRYVDEDGVPRVLSSEQVIARQMRGEAFAPGQLAEVVGLPLQHVLTLMGEQSLPEQVTAPWGEQAWSPDVSQVPTYTRFPAQAWTEEMFGGLVATVADESGQAVSWGTRDLLEEPELRNQSLPKARVRSYTGVSPSRSRDYWGPFRKHQEKVHGARGQVQGATTKWAEQRKTVRERVAVRRTNVGAQVLQAVQLAAEGHAGDASRLLSAPRPDVKATNDFSTAWEYVHHGARNGGVVNGVLSNTQEIGENAAIDDEVIVLASTFSPAKDLLPLEQRLTTARGVLRELMAVGATITLPVDPLANDLRRELTQFLREHDYRATEPGGETFEPAPRGDVTQSEAAFHSKLNGATWGTSTNRVPIDLADLDFNPIDENAIYTVNGGLGALESYDVPEVVQTARYAGYGLPLSAEANTRAKLINTLLPVLRSEEGRTYLAAQAGVDEGDFEQSKDFVRALDLLEARLVEARSNPRHPLHPTRGDDFGTGDIIPLVSFNERDELAGIHLVRHGHMPVDEALLRGAALPDGNQALGAGVRLTIDKAKVDASHTTHRGELVDAEWLGMAGYIARIRVRMSDFGSKVFESGTGMKWVTSVAPDTLYVPRHALFAGRPVLGVANLAAPAAKTSDGGWLNTPSRIVEAVGFNVLPHLVRLLKGVDYAENDAAYASARNEVVDLLGRFRAMHGSPLDPVALVTRRTDEFGLAVEEFLQRSLDDVLAGDSVTLDATGADEQRVADVAMTQLVLQALAAGASLDEVLGAPGYIGRPAGSKSHTMHPVFTTLLHQLPDRHPARRAFVAQVNARMPWDGGNGYELLPNLTWVRHVTAPDGKQYEVPTMLAFPEVRATDTNDTLSEMAAGRRQRGSISGTTLAMAYVTWGAQAAHAKQLARGAEVFAPNELLADEQGAKKLFFNYSVDAALTRADADLRLNAEEARHIFEVARPRRRALQVPIDTAAWYVDVNKVAAKSMATAYSTLFAATRRALGLTKEDSHLLQELIRTVVVRPATAPGDGEYLSHREAMAALKLIKANAQRGDLPTHGGAINVPSRELLERLYQGKYALRGADGKNRPVNGWDEWVNVMLSDAFSDDSMMRGYPAVSNLVDGLLYEYRKDVLGLPATVQNRLAGVLGSVLTRNGLLVSSPVARRRMDAPGAQGGQAIYDVEDYASADWEFDELPQSARELIEARMTKWEAARGLTRRRVSPRREAIRGAQVREGLARTNVVMRFAQLGIVLKTLVNPGLWVSAFVELGIRGGQESLVSFLAGEDARIQGFTPAQRQQWNDTVAKLAKNSEFYGMVYDHTNWNPEGASETRLEERLQRFTNMATAMFNDPTWGISSKTMARTFMEAAWYTVSHGADTRAVTIEQFLDTMATSPQEIAKISSGAAAHGYSRIEYRRNLQDNLAERARRKVVEGVINSGGPGTNTLGVLFLRFPTLFFRFRSNTIINMLGLQGPHAVLASLMSDRTKRSGGLKDYAAGNADDLEVSEQARIEDSYDLTRAIIRSGVSHTQLLVLGTILSAAGFGGDEDDEAKLLDKLRRYQQAPVAKDPLALENDFRNAEAWFADFLPAGMGVPSWIIRPFVSPAMGIARFHETGDIRQVLWGFTDALGNLPLLNADTVLNSWMVAHELIEAAEAESQDTSDEATAKAAKLLFTAVGTLEAMLFESSFASMIYQGADEWDRDPYKIPLINAEGEPQLYKNGTPRPTTMLNEFINDDGEVQQGYASRTDYDAMLHALGENRPVFAHVMSLIMRDSSYIRYNMPAKTREVDAAPVTQDEATRIIVSVFNHESGAEELTLDGAAGVIRGVQMGTVGLDSPSLGGIFITNEMRGQIQEVLLGELVEKYLTLDFSKSEALTRAKVEFYGQAYGEPEGLGLADIIWSDKIPGYQTQKYMQLNTTYVIGPNGQPIATGLDRSVMGALGLNLAAPGFDTYLDDSQSNMGVDDLLNSTDAARGLNLGQRGLVKVDESWVTPTAEEIGDSIESALEKIADEIDDLNDSFGGYGGYGRSGYGGGGGGGYSRAANYGGGMQRLNTPRGIDTPYALSPRVANPGNPIIRRATIRRERFSSDRGRLNQWQ